MITAEIIADSLSPKHNRITTFVVQIPRIVLAEFNTHRMLSRNSASSRAIPFEKMLDAVRHNPFIPIRWMKDHTGMQGNEYFENEYDIQRLKAHWLIGRDYAMKTAESLSYTGLTKQIVNRLLEPFMWHKIIVTATEWENFFALRAHDAAEIHIQELAYKMLAEYNDNTPRQLKAGEWHIPFGDKFDEEKLRTSFTKGMITESNIQTVLTVKKVEIATARCARVSYNNFDGSDDYEKDIQLHDRLQSMGHLSRFEHCAYACSDSNWSGNFKGFIQYRKIFDGESKSDNRVVKK